MTTGSTGRALRGVGLNVYKLIGRVRPEQLGALVKILLRVSRRHVRSFTGHTFWLDPVSPLGLTLLQGQPYEAQMLALVQELLRPSDTFVDLGANEGYFSIVASSCVGASGRVLAVEPQAALHPVLNENIRANAASNVSVHRRAIYDKNGQGRLFLRSSINHGASRLGHRFRAGFGSESVALQTLADFLREQHVSRARLLKVDCEGAEIEIVEGSRELFAARAFDIVALEYHPGTCGLPACQRVHGQMTEWGYRLAQWNGQTVYYLPEVAGDLSSVDPEIELDATLRWLDARGPAP